MGLNGLRTAKLACCSSPAAEQGHLISVSLQQALSPAGSLTERVPSRSTTTEHDEVGHGRELRSIHEHGPAASASLQAYSAPNSQASLPSGASQPLSKSKHDHVIEV